jgi:pyruvate,water dikinase
MTKDYVVWLHELRMADVARVGGKNASLGELIGELAPLGVRVPGGFATTAEAYRDFLAAGGLDQRIEEALGALDVGDVAALARCGSTIRGWIEAQPLQPELEQAIREAYAEMQQREGGDFTVAVRSSATAEDLPDASFAGQQETKRISTFTASMRCCRRSSAYSPRCTTIAPFPTACTRGSCTPM